MQIKIVTEEIEKLAKVLSVYCPKATIKLASGLLTVPSFQANTLRIEILVHLAVLNCNGHKIPEYKELKRWLNKYLGATKIKDYEDPVENSFVTNILTPIGNMRILEGSWHSNDYFLQDAIDTLLQPNVPEKYQKKLLPCFALLQLSESSLQKLDLQRWHSEPSTPSSMVDISIATQIDKHANSLIFTNQELTNLGISKELLSVFVLQESDRKKISEEIIGASSLERYPLIDFEEVILLSLPTAISAAIRRFLISELKQLNTLKQFELFLAIKQLHDVHAAFDELHSSSVPIDLPQTNIPHLPSLNSSVIKYDFKHYIHIIVLHDDLNLADEQGITSFMRYNSSQSKALNDYILSISEYCNLFPDFFEGTVMIIMGGLGRGYRLEFEKWPQKWRMSVLRISDFITLANETGKPIKRFLKCIKHKEQIESEGVFFHNTSDDFNFYGYWCALNFQLVPRELPVTNGSVVTIFSDYIFPTIEKIQRTNDIHLAQTVSGEFAKVMRLGRDTYFQSMKHRPIYASLTHLKNKNLAGVIETSRGTTWLKIDGQPEISRILYDLWSGIIALLEKLLIELETLEINLPKFPIEILLNFHDAIPPKEIVNLAHKTETLPRVLIDNALNTGEIIVPSDFFSHFQKPDNTGEKILFTAIAKVILNLLSNNPQSNDKIIDFLIQKTLGDSNIRLIHLFNNHSRIDYLLANQKVKIDFLPHEDFVFSKLKLSDGCIQKHIKTIDDKDECNKFLKNVANKVLNEIKFILHQFERASVIKKALEIHEAIIQDRDQWRRTSNAILALYGAGEDIPEVAYKREQDRSKLAIALKTILEMAICECPNEGRQLSNSELDELLAITSLFLETATNSDAIYNEFANPPIVIHENGEYTINHDKQEEIICPFIENYFREEFDAMATNYEKYYKSHKPSNEKISDVFPSDFICAYVAEFKLNPDEALDGFITLIELAEEQANPVVEVSIKELKDCLTTKAHLSSQACEAFIDMFTLFHRTPWDTPPNNYTAKDIYPWRFRRRLSVSVKPILASGKNDTDNAWYGIATFQLAFDYFFRRIEAGNFPASFFKSDEMKKYVGSTNRLRGNEFGETVAAYMKKNGWTARTEIQMTELGALPKLGDVDVLAWHPTGKILIIECKKLQLARTVSEIADICERFKGEANDELAKHLARVNWINQNLVCLEKIVGFKPNPSYIDHLLVTNTHVPMMYISTLPIDQLKIVSLNNLFYQIA